MQKNCQDHERKDFIFNIDNKQVDVLPLLHLVVNEDANTIAAALDTFLFQYLTQPHDAEPSYLPNIVSTLKEVRDAFLRVGNGTELYFYVSNGSKEQLESKLYWEILKDK